MSQHTEGKWEVDRWSGQRYGFFVKGERNGKPCVIAEKFYDEDNEPTLEELEANVNLIANAPDLLEALKRLFGDVENFASGSVRMRPAVANARVAIAKASEPAWVEPRSTEA